MDESMGKGTQNDAGYDAISKHMTAGTTNIDETKKKEIKENLAKYEQLFGADEDAFAQPTTTRKELWSYYLYYNVC
jgi:hypothetical protein